ncbi:hypothetical protein N9C20_02145 [Luminiphilus sp.]|nr:hypothetical protein [Luminiphilus sp.]
MNGKVTSDIKTSGANKHPWSEQIKFADAPVEAPEFVIDNVISAGAVAIAGFRGVGKTSCLIPLILNAAHLVKQSQVSATICRQIFYITEDPRQVMTIIAGMYKAGEITCDTEHFNRMFHIVDAKRISPTDIASFVDELHQFKQPNKRIDGSIFNAWPVTVLDTTNASINLDNINDNAEVSAAISAIRSGFKSLPIIFVGHVPKAKGTSANSASFMGAGAWENDTQQTLYLWMEGEKRLLSMGKRRFECEVTDYEIKSIYTEIPARNQLGRDLTMRSVYGKASPISKAHLKQMKAERMKKNAAELRKRILDTIKATPGIKIADIKESIGGSSQAITDAIAFLARGDQIRIEKEGRAKHCYPVAQMGSTAND